MRYFTFLRDLAMTSAEVLDAGDCQTPVGLYDVLRSRYDFPDQLQHFRVAINGVFSPMDTTLRDNDEIAFIPPVSGG